MNKENSINANEEDIFAEDILEKYKTEIEQAGAVNDDDDTDGGVFFGSLSGLTQNDIALNETAKNVKKPSVDFLRYFMLAVSLAIFIYASYSIVGRIVEYISAGQEYDALKNLVYSGQNGLAPEAEVLKKTRANVPIEDILAIQKQAGSRVVEADKTDSYIKQQADQPPVNLNSIAGRSRDLFGWLKVYDTRIDYPVVHRPEDTENEYYLKHTFDGKSNSSGAIFVDFTNSSDVDENYNTVIYGHNMLDGSMFQPIINFSRYEYFTNGLIELTTEKAIYYYEVFSAREEDPFSGYVRTNFTKVNSAGEEELDLDEYFEFLNEMQDRSIFTKDMEFTADTRIITLSTCVNDRRDWRFTVQGVLIEVLLPEEE